MEVAVDMRMIYKCSLVYVSRHQPDVICEHMHMRMDEVRCSFSVRHLLVIHVAKIDRNCHNVESIYILSNIDTRTSVHQRRSCQGDGSQP